MEIKELPELPPAWKWHENAGKDFMSIKWQALGPKIGFNKLKAYGRTEDTPEEAAAVAWEFWEHISGLTREKYDKIKEIE